MKVLNKKISLAWLFSSAEIHQRKWCISVANGLYSVSRVKSVVEFIYVHLPKMNVIPLAVYSVKWPFSQGCGGR